MRHDQRWRSVMLRCILSGGFAGASSGVVWAGVLSLWSLMVLRDGPVGAGTEVGLPLVSALWAGSVGAVLGVVAGAALGASTALVGERWNARWLSPGLLLAVLPPLVVVALALVGITRVLPLVDATGPFLVAGGVRAGRRARRPPPDVVAELLVTGGRGSSGTGRGPSPGRNLGG